MIRIIFNETYSKGYLLDTFKSSLSHLRYPQEHAVSGEICQLLGT